MNPALPATVAAALDRLCEGVSGVALAERAAAISAHYRGGGGSAPVIRAEIDALAYAVTRAPATYAAVAAALDALADRADLDPATLLDLGCGPGTATWAAFETYEGLASAVLLDANRALLDLGDAIQEGEARAVERRLADITTAPLPAADLAIAAYVLTELGDAAAVALAERMWAVTGQALVLVEPGTPAGWARLMAVRRRLIELGATIAAPCPHHDACPLAPPDWCHFAQRLPRLRAHRRAKGADAPYEDEKYAYVAAVRPTVGIEPATDRIIAPPVEEKAAVTLKLCRTDGQAAWTPIPRRDKAALRAVRRLGWGDRRPDEA